MWIKLAQNKAKHITKKVLNKQNNPNSNTSIDAIVQKFEVHAATTIQIMLHIPQLTSMWKMF
jgi:uncharacterized protein (UPF0333 family)